MNLLRYMRGRKDSIRAFRARVWSHYRAHRRHSLPWRHTRDPYSIVVSEIMLQQTQVARVSTFYPKFLKRFPTFQALAKAPRQEILKCWQGLGYNRRAMALHRLAQQVITHHSGTLPRDQALLETLPGIGRATAGSILAFAFDVSVPFTETNIRRVFIHHFFPKRKRVGEDEILAMVSATLPRNHSREWYWALMDYGAWLAKRTENPNRRHARYRRQPKFEGSSRELRGKILAHFLAHPRTRPATLAREFETPLRRAKRVLAALKKEGLVT